MTRAIALLLLALALAACPRAARKTLVPDVPSSGDADARARFLDARRAFLRDGTRASEFGRIAADFPDDPIVPWAELYAGMAALRARDFVAAEAQLGKLVESDTAPGLVARARLLLGIVKNYTGDASAARALLAGAEPAVEGEDERTEYLAALAYATAAGDRPLAALPVFDQLYPRVTPVERSLIVARCEELVAALDREALGRLFDALDQRTGPALAAVGSRLVALLDAAGDTSRAAAIRDRVAAARAQVGLPRTLAEVDASGAAGAAGQVGVVGAVLPLGSKEEGRIAEAAVAGLSVAAGAFDGKGVAAIETRAAADKDAAAEAVEQLARHAVTAVVGPIKGGAVDAAAARAEALGVPLISLATNAELRARGRFVFHIRHSPDARARSLAQRALVAGIRSFAVLAPESDYGRGTTKAFVAAVEQGGGQIVRSVSYAPATRSFSEQAGRLGDGWDAVFVADDAQHLALIAPALAASGHVSRATPLPRKKLVSGRAVLLLSLAEGLDAGYLGQAGRHTVGALLAPGFFPDAAEPASREFVERFTAAFGRPPGATEAYAFDAAQLVAAAGASGRAGLAALLGTSQLPGVTGALRFDAEHRRADPGVVYTVVEETAGLAIRVSK